MSPSFELFDRVPVGIVVMDSGRRVKFWNLCIEHWTGIPRGDILHRPLTDFFPRFGEDRYRTRLELVQAGGPPAIFSYQINGSLFPHRDPRKMRRIQHATATHLRSEAGEDLVMIALEDRTEVAQRIASARAEVATRIETERVLRTAVKEKEFLLRELNHRVKNNLNMILSLIQLQKDGIGGDKFAATLEDLENRVRSFAILQDAMHRGGNPQAVRLDEYLGDIAAQVFDALKRPQSEVVLKVVVQPISRPFKDALYLGLIICEAITNSMKYAVGHFGETGREGTCVSIELKGSVFPEAGLVLKISDNGPGFPQGMNPLEGESLGLKLLQLLVSELDGTLAFGPGPGATIVVTLNNGNVSTEG